MLGGIPESLKALPVFDISRGIEGLIIPFQHIGPPACSAVRFRSVVLQEFLFNYVEHWSYLGLFVVLFVAGMGVPLPEDIPLVASGWLVHRGLADFNLMVLIGLIGVLAGDTLMFSMGRRYGNHLVGHRWLQWIAKPWLVARAREQFERHGAKILFAARFMPGLRSVVFLTAGTFRVPYWKFWTFDGTAALISVPVWIWCGKYFGGRIEQLLGGAKIASYVIVGLLVTAFALFAVLEYRKIKKKNAALASQFADGKVQAISEVPGEFAEPFKGPSPREPLRRPPERPEMARPRTEA
jgi:membrane protein DedA with SNARE-associated domain